MTIAAVDALPVAIAVDRNATPAGVHEFGSVGEQSCFEALFFASLLILMAKSDISLLWPLTGLSFVFATFAAMWFLHEQVSPIRWVGVVCIMIGAGLITYSEHAKPKPPATSALGPRTEAPK